MPYHDQDLYAEPRRRHPQGMHGGEASGHQDHGKTGEPQGYKEAKGTLSNQVRDHHVDGKQFACDEGGLSSKFGKGMIGDKRGTSGGSGSHDINMPVREAGDKNADTESMPGH